MSDVYLSVMTSKTHREDHERTETRASCRGVRRGPMPAQSNSLKYARRAKKLDGTKV